MRFRSSTLLASLLGCLSALLGFESSLSARPRPKGPTPLDQRLEAWAQHRSLEESSDFRGLPWRCVGPVVQGGRLVDIEISPTDPYTFYVAYASGGLWRTENNGLSFEALFDDQPTTIMADVALDPNDPERIWVGTGENNSSRSSYGGLGVYRSDDGGENWRYMGLGDTDRIGRIHVDPRDGNRVVVTALGRLYTDSGERGIYVSSDGGESWERVLEGDGMTGFVDLVPDPTNPDVLYASSWERSRRPWNFVEGGDGSGIWKSTDSGRSWSRLGGGFPRGEHVGRIGLSVSRSHPQTVYAYVDNQELLPEELWDLGDGAVTAKRLRTMSKEEFLEQDPEEIEDFVRSADLHPEIDATKLIEMVREDEVTLQDLIDALADANANLFETDIHGAQVWRSDDGGTSWRRTHEGPIRQMVYTYGYYFGQIRVSPLDPDRVYIMGVPILRSDDGGQSWKGLDDRVVHVDYQSMHIDRSDHDRVIVGNDGGLAMSWDGGETWIELNSIPVGQFYTVAVDMAEPYNIYGGLQDNGTWKGSSRARPTDKNAWTFINGGDGFYVQIDARDNQTTYTGYQFGYYARIDPDGSRHRVRPRNRLKEPALRYNWMTPIQLSSHHQDILYFGANRLFRSMDQGKTWTALSEDLTENPSRGDVPFGTITTLDESAETFGLVWAGTDDGQLWLTVDGGVSWRDVDDRLPRDRWISRVEASTHARERAYVSFNGYRDDDMSPYLFLTEDLGERWQPISEGLPAEPINVVREDPENEDLLYVGTDRGVYVSRDRGESWQALPTKLPNVPVHDLVVHPRDHELVAGTHGRSVWVLDVAPIQELDEEIEQQAIHVFEPGEIQARRGWRSRRSLWFYRPEQDDPSHSFHAWTRDGGPLSVEILDVDERPLRRWEVDASPGLNQIEWDLLLDPELALPAERARLAAEESENENLDSADGGSSETPSEVTRAMSPWTEAIRLQRPLYVTAGDYRIRLSIGGESASAELIVKAPPARPPRESGPLSRPGRLHP